MRYVLDTLTTPKQTEDRQNECLGRKKPPCVCVCNHCYYFLAPLPAASRDVGPRGLWQFTVTITRPVRVCPFVGQLFSCHDLVRPKRSRNRNLGELFTAAFRKLVLKDGLQSVATRNYESIFHISSVTRELVKRNTTEVLSHCLSRPSLIM